MQIRFAVSDSPTSPRLALTSPWPESLLAFQRIWPRLSRTAPVLALDLPGFGRSERRTDTTYRWHDDSVNFTREDDIKARFAEIMKGQFDPQEMISIIGADDGKCRNVWPPAIEDPVKQVQEGAWTRPVQHS